MTAPTGTTSKAQGAGPAGHLDDQRRPSPRGQFSIWVVSPANGWYVGKIHDAAERRPASYADSVDLNVPVDTGYRVFVYYRATQRRPLGHLRHEPRARST